MMDKKLQDLQKITPPPPSERMKNAAISAAMQAFEQAGEKSEKTTQGMGAAGRLIHSINQLWSRLMKKQLVMGTALASVLAVFVGIGIQHQFNPVGVLTEKMESHDNEINISRKKTAPDIPDISADIAPPPPAIYTPPEIPVSQPSSLARMAEKKAEVRASGVAAQRAVSADIAPPPPPIYTPPQIPMAESAPAPQMYTDREQYEKSTPNPVKQVMQEPVSTFSVDVDTASYSVVRSSLNAGRLPQPDAVRVEEMINYFDYDYPLPESREQPFKPTVAVYPTPWNAGTKLMHIGIKGLDVTPAEKPRSNLVFLIDVSGSMNDQNKLPLLKNAFSMMVENLDEDDTVAIVTYAGQAGTVLEPTKVAEKDKILAALGQLQSGGGTAGAQGIEQAYALARSRFDDEGVNRVILATDGDFNVGITDREQLKTYIEKQRDSGIFLSVLGFGRGNYNDALMQTLAQNGNGVAAYIDTLNEARKVLVDEASSTLFPIAKDVKIQIEFNPNVISEYRLIGYETRMLAQEDFNNDKIDAGDIGSGHTVTAIYEITPVGSESELIDDLRYSKPKIVAEERASNEYGFLKLRYKLPKESTSKLIELPVTVAQEVGDVTKASADIRFAASVAGFGQLLKGDKHMGSFSYDNVLELAKDARGEDEFGYRAEFMNLVRTAKALK